MVSLVVELLKLLVIENLVLEGVFLYRKGTLVIKRGKLRKEKSIKRVM